MVECKAIATPASNAHWGVDATEKIETKHFYPAAIGSLLYLVLETRPDLARSPGLGRTARSRRQQLGRMPRGSCGTLEESANLGIEYKRASSTILVGFCGSDWVSGNDRKTVKDCVFCIPLDVISWLSWNQCKAALSSQEAELTAASEAAWLQKVLQDPRIPMSMAIKSMQEASNMTPSSSIHKKHKRAVKFERFDSNANVADSLTKLLQSKQLEMHHPTVSIVDYARQPLAAEEECRRTRGSTDASSQRSEAEQPKESCG